VLTGELNSQERSRVLGDFLDSADGALLCSCQALQEGVNLPGANMVRTVVIMKVSWDQKVLELL
jgi:Rad3-related DNA helicase